MDYLQHNTEFTFPHLLFANFGNNQKLKISNMLSSGAISTLLLGFIFLLSSNPDLPNISTNQILQLNLDLEAAEEFFYLVNWLIPKEHSEWKTGEKSSPTFYHQSRSWSQGQRVKTTIQIMTNLSIALENYPELLSHWLAKPLHKENLRWRNTLKHTDQWTSYRDQEG